MTVWLAAHELKTLRPRLLRLGYRMLGSRADAEDIVQEACLAALAMTEPPHRPDAWLAKVVTTRSIDLLRQRKRQRESYVGPWLPEPFFEEKGSFDGDIAAISDDGISMAVMRLLDRLSPLERAAFLLHDMFGLPFDEIGAALDRSAATCRKLASRARSALKADVPRFPAQSGDVARLAALLERCVRSGDTAELAAALADDIVLVSDGGANVRAARRVLQGRAEVLEFLAAILAGMSSGGAPGARLANGSIALTFTDPGEPASVVFIDLSPEGLLQGIYIQRNPDKLNGLTGA